MTGIEINRLDADGYNLIEFEGELDLANFIALFGVVKGYTKQKCIPVVVDLSGDISISDELSKFDKGCLGLYGCPFDISYLLFIIVCSQDRFDKLQKLLNVECPIRHAESIREAIDWLNEMQPTQLRC